MFFNPFGKKNSKCTICRDHEQFWNVEISRLSLTDKKLEVRLNKFNEETVSNLYLFENKLTASSGEVLKKFVCRQKTTLKILTIIGNNLGDNGISAITSVINENHLEKLVIVNNMFSDTAVIELCEKLKTNTSLETLNMSNNRLGVASLSAITNMLKINSTLKYLILERNGLFGCRDKLDELLRVATEENTSLKGMEIMGADMRPGFLYALGEFYWSRRDPNAPVYID